MRKMQMSQIYDALKLAFSSEQIQISIGNKRVTTDQVSAWQELMQISFEGISTDTRKNLESQLFIALKGESFDAHDFLDKAISGKAKALLFESRVNLSQLSSVIGDIISIQIPDSLIALQSLGTWARRQSRAKVIGITGSNGKTTTKEFTAAIIGASRSVHFNVGSFNNHWGVPFNLLQLPADVDAAVVEMGMNHYGEIKRLVEIAEPDIVCCTMVGRAHIEHFGTIEGIAEAKNEIYLHSSKNATAVFNLDNPLTAKMLLQDKERNPNRKRILFSEKDESADIFLQMESMNLNSMKIRGRVQNKSHSVSVSVFGAQNLVNLMAASALALAAGLTAEEVWKGLENCKTSWGRNQLMTTVSGSHLIFDAYNANPDSMKALLENVRNISISGKKIGIFGEMLEMGHLKESLHQELGSEVGRSGFSHVLFLGSPQKSFVSGLKESDYAGEYFGLTEFDAKISAQLSSLMAPDDLVVIKGSRGMKLERFLPECK